MDLSRIRRHALSKALFRVLWSAPHPSRDSRYMGFQRTGQFDVDGPTVAQLAVLSDLDAGRLFSRIAIGNLYITTHHSAEDAAGGPRFGMLSFGSCSLQEDNG